MPSETWQNMNIRYIRFGDLLGLLMLSTLTVAATVGTTIKQEEAVTTSAANTWSPKSCGEPCANCSADNVCLQICPGGYYYVNQSTTTTSMSEATTTTTTTTTPTTTTETPSGTVAVMAQLSDEEGERSSNGTEPHPSCRWCSDAIPHCDECHLDQSIVICSRCSIDYTASSSKSECLKPSKFPDWAIAVIVVVSVLILTGAGVAIFFAVRRYNHHKPRTPPQFPKPELI